MPALNHTVTEDVVRAAQLSMPRSEFARAYLNRWVASMGDPVIDIDLWESLASTGRPTAGEPDPRRRCQSPIQVRRNRRRWCP